MKTANNLLRYRNHTPELSDGFYHADCPELFAQHDVITTLADCPFPLVTDSFRVIHFGTSISQPDDLAKGYGNTKRFAVVEYVKACGHLAQDRITFTEDVKDFDHYGTKFIGASYSIKDWAARIEFFRNTPCDVCAMIQHSLWVWSEGLSESNRVKTVAALRRTLDYNYLNWQEFADWAKVEARFAATKRGSRSIAA